MTLIDLDLLPPPEPPRKGESLFPEGIRGVPVGSRPWQTCQHYPYAEGYLLAARALVERATLEHIFSRFLVYPIIFLYRHSLELTLKACILRGSSALGNDLTNEARQHVNSSHDLFQLWRDYLPILHRMNEAAGTGWQVDESELEGVGDHISQFSEIDPSSFAFRYPFRRDGVSAAIPEDLYAVDIPHVHRQMERLVARLRYDELVIDYLRDMNIEADYWD